MGGRAFRRHGRKAAPPALRPPRRAENQRLQGCGKALSAEALKIRRSSAVQSVLVAAAVLDAHIHRGYRSLRAAGRYSRRQPSLKLVLHPSPATNMKLSYGLILLFLTPFLAGRDQLGLETPAAELAREEAEGKAIGSACRQAGRALEDCYQINRRAPKAAIFAGWRDMDGYMRENKIEEVKPDFPLQPLPRKGRPLAAIEE